MNHCSPILRGWFTGLLRRYKRIVIVGPSGCGKSTLADEIQIDGRPVLHSDDFKRFRLEDLPASVRAVADKQPDGSARVPHDVIEAAERRGEKWPDTRVFEQAGASEEIIRACKAAGDKWVFEGVMGARALRKSLQLGLGPLSDAVILLEHPRREQLKGQVIQGKAIMTVFHEWRRMDRNRTPVWKVPEEDYETSGQADLR